MSHKFFSNPYSLNKWRDARAAEGARLEIVCILKKVYRGFESPSLRQEKGTGVREQGRIRIFF
jgi:hypothetical protein